MAEGRIRRPPPSAALWAAALLVMLASAVWQRLTGPTHPRSGHAMVEGREVSWRLLRSGISGEPLRVEIEAPEGVSGTLRWRRYPIEEDFNSSSMLREGDTLLGLLPTQPPAGKLEYSLVLAGPSGLTRIPKEGPVVMRFKGHVPLVVLVPHVLIIFLSMLIGIRAALAAIYARPETRWLAWATVVGITVGGMMLGPVVQKFAFGAFWTGWPFGRDLTDNKTLVMWIAWIVAVVALSGTREVADRFSRTLVVAAAVVMIAVYLVPHSLRGSQLDYQKLDAGESASESITTGH